MGLAILELDGVSKKFGALTVAEQISFAVGEGEALGIIGPNGAGKSTLFNLITGNIPADSGSIRFLGSDVTRTPPMARCLSGMRFLQIVPIVVNNLPRTAVKMAMPPGRTNRTAINRPGPDFGERWQ